MFQTDKHPAANFPFYVAMSEPMKFGQAVKGLQCTI